MPDSDNGDRPLDGGRGPAAGTALAYASLVVADVGRSAEFYAAAVGLTPGWTGSPSTFRSMLSARSGVGLSWPGVTDLLGVDAGTRGFLTFDPGSADGVRERTDLLLALGATLVRGPAPTGYGTVQSVLTDLDGHVIRLDHSTR